MPVVTETQTFDSELPENGLSESVLAGPGQTVTGLAEPSETSGLELACLAAKVADDYRGVDTVVLDLRLVTPVFDFFVIASGSSHRQMRSLAEEVNRVMKRHGSRSPGMEGDVGSPWLLYDYGDIVLHVLSPEARKLYNLEELWADAKYVDWKAVYAASAEGQAATAFAPAVSQTVLSVGSD